MKKHFLQITCGTCFSLGIVLAGSDGAGFPWINLIGVVIFALTLPLAWKLEGMED